MKRVSIAVVLAVAALWRRQLRFERRLAASCREDRELLVDEVGRQLTAAGTAWGKWGDELVREIKRALGARAGA